MGSWKERAMDDQEDRQHEKLAAHLGISYDELMELGHEFHEHTGNDDALYGYYVTFDSSAPEKILKKIPGIDLKNRMVDLDLNWDNDEEDRDDDGEG